MAQPSVAQYFNTRKRSATEEHKINSARKVLILDEESLPKIKKLDVDKNVRGLGPSLDRREVIKKVINAAENQQPSKSTVRVAKLKKAKPKAGQCIQTFLDNMKGPERCLTPLNQTESGKEITDKDGNDQPDERCCTPPNPINTNEKELQIVKKKILQSSKLSELKASIKNFKKCAEQLKAAEKKTSEISQSPKLKTFKSIEFEVTISPQKAQSPDKPYLSPRKKEPPSVRKNLLTILSPVKQTTVESSDVSTKLKLPFKYRTLAEIFRAVDAISQMLFNRRETITFRKLKPAVEEMLKRTFSEKHLAQIKAVYPDAYDYRREKIKQIGSRREEWNLVVAPAIGAVESMTPEILLQRRRKLHELLVELVKDYHDEFLRSLEPPMAVAKDEIARWHPEFDLEKVPDVGLAELPEAPLEDKVSTGKDVLERARQMFGCNTRMEQALARLRASGAIAQAGEGARAQPESVLKGVPKALLERVRQKQAAKALMSMTRSVDKDREIRMYSRLPEIARLTRNLFVSEKKNVLPLDTVVEKLGNSYRSFLNKSEIEELLKTLAGEVPDWLVFHNLKNSVYLKLAKNADLSKILDKLETLAKEKSEL